jgi:hypothetical protein
MSAVIRGGFHTYVSKENPPAVVGTTLGVTVNSTRAARVSIKISRQAYTWPGQKNPAFSAKLPWANAQGSKLSPYTANPYSSNPPTVVGNKYGLNIAFGTHGLANLKAGTQQLPAVNSAIGYGGLYTLFPGEQKLAPVPSCPTPNDEGLSLSDTPGASTICWLFKDGDA